MHAPIERRTFLATLAALAATATHAPGTVGRRGARGPVPTRLILLGTGAGPRPRRGRMSTAQAIVAGGRLYVVDCGDGVARQLVVAGLPLDALRHVFITHHHSDHDADYGNLLLLAWASGLRHRVDTWGPPPIERITSLFLEMSAPDIEARIADQGSAPLAPLIHAHDLAGAGVVMRDADVEVTCALVDHPPVKQALAYRFDAADRSIVISGDTRRSDDLVRLARGADVLVHEALYPAAVDRIVAGLPNATSLRKRIVDSHTSAEDCGRVAAAAGVRTLVLSHLAPADDSLVTDRMWLDAARRHFDGRIIVAHDLMEV